jgi:hypothetical protein
MSREMTHGITVLLLMVAFYFDSLALYYPPGLIANLYDWLAWNLNLPPLQIYKTTCV